MDKTFETELCEIAYKYKTDKCPQIAHNYTPFYYNLFKDKRNDIKKVLEFGIGGQLSMGSIEQYITGASLRMWRDFFPNAQIYGADIEKTCLFEDERIQTYLCNERSPKEVTKLIRRIGNDLDIIIDDASHYYKDQIFLFSILTPLLKSNFTYIIEDVKSVRYVRKKIGELGYNSRVPELPKNKKFRRGGDSLIVMEK